MPPPPAPPRRTKYAFGLTNFHQKSPEEPRPSPPPIPIWNPSKMKLKQLNNFIEKKTDSEEEEEQKEEITCAPTYHLCKQEGNSQKADHEMSTSSLASKIMENNNKNSTFKNMEMVVEEKESHKEDNMKNRTYGRLRRLSLNKRNKVIEARERDHVVTQSRPKSKNSQTKIDDNIHKASLPFLESIVNYQNCNLKSIASEGIMNKHRRLKIGKVPQNERLPFLQSIIGFQNSTLKSVAGIKSKKENPYSKVDKVAQKDKRHLLDSILSFQSSTLKSVVGIESKNENSYPKIDNTPQKDRQNLMESIINFPNGTLKLVAAKKPENASPSQEANTSLHKDRESSLGSTVEKPQENRKIQPKRDSALHDDRLLFLESIDNFQNDTLETVTRNGTKNKNPHTKIEHDLRKDQLPFLESIVNFHNNSLKTTMGNESQTRNPHTNMDNSLSKGQLPFLNSIVQFQNGTLKMVDRNESGTSVKQTTEESELKKMFPGEKIQEAQGKNILPKFEKLHEENVQTSNFSTEHYQKNKSSFEKPKLENSATKKLLNFNCTELSAGSNSPKLMQVIAVEKENQLQHDWDGRQGSQERRLTKLVRMRKSETSGNRIQDEIGSHQVKYIQSPVLHQLRNDSEKKRSGLRTIKDVHSKAKSPLEGKTATMSLKTPVNPEINMNSVEMNTDKKSMNIACNKQVTKDITEDLKLNMRISRPRLSIEKTVMKSSHQLNKPPTTLTNELVSDKHHSILSSVKPVNDGENQQQREVTKPAGDDPNSVKPGDGVKRQQRELSEVLNSDIVSSNDTCSGSIGKNLQLDDTSEVEGLEKELQQLTQDSEKLITSVNLTLSQIETQYRVLREFTASIEKSNKIISGNSISPTLLTEMKSLQSSILLLTALNSPYAHDNIRKREEDICAITKTEKMIEKCKRKAVASMKKSCSKARTQKIQVQNDQYKNQILELRNHYAKQKNKIRKKIEQRYKQGFSKYVADIKIKEKNLDSLLLKNRKRLAQEVERRKSIESAQIHLNIVVEHGSKEEIDECIMNFKKRFEKDRKKSMQALRENLQKEYRYLNNIGLTDSRIKIHRNILDKVNKAIPFTEKVVEAYKSKCLELQDALLIVLRCRRFKIISESMKDMKFRLDEGEIDRAVHENIASALQSQSNLLQENVMETEFLITNWKEKYEDTELPFQILDIHRSSVLPAEQK